jgi:hypothetical protein
MLGSKNRSDTFPFKFSGNESKFKSQLQAFMKDVGYKPRGTKLFPGISDDDLESGVDAAAYYLNSKKSGKDSLITLVFSFEDKLLYL